MSAYYGTVELADDYFSRRLYRDIWFAGDPDNKLKAMYMAAERIDRLNFIGEKTDSAQELAFPRNGETEVPSNILKASYEIAFAFKDGRDPDLEYELLRKQYSSVGPARSSFNTDLVPQHIVNGIPSMLAWTYLKPFIRDRSEIALKRS